MMAFTSGAGDKQPGSCARGRLANRIVYWLARALARILGWSVAGRLPDDPKYVIISTHTSNWDFAIALLGMAVLSCGFLDVGFAWLGKRELFWGPLGSLLRLIGGIPIDRSARHDTVQQLVASFRRRQRMALIVTPEGTRSRTRRWKSGFYYLALGAQVPIVLGYLDYRRRVVGAGPLLMPSGNLDADLATMRDFYLDKAAMYPDQVGTIGVEPPDRA